MLPLTFLNDAMLLNPKVKRTIYLFYLLFLTAPFTAFAQVSTIADNGWANNSVNTVIFRKNSLVTFKSTQYAAFYNAEQFVVLAKRTQTSPHWQVQQTIYKGDAADAHKSISIMIDGEGCLHIAWGHHNQPLNYARSIIAGQFSAGRKTVHDGPKRR
jgi:hypothetical protein